VSIPREEVGDSELTEQDQNQRKQAKQDKARGAKGRCAQIAGREVKNALLSDG
jgi:hypothetical protein